MQKAFRTMHPHAIWIACILITLISSTTDAKTLQYDSIDIEMRIDPSGRVDVTETQRIKMYGTWNGIYRYFGTVGADSIILLAAGEAERPYEKGYLDKKYKYNTKHDRFGFKAKLRVRNPHDPPFRNEYKTFIFKYAIYGAINYGKSGDILDWKTLFTRDREAVKHVRLRISLPEYPDGVTIRAYSRSAIKPVYSRDGYVIQGNDLKKTDPFRIKLIIPKGVLTGIASALNHYLHVVKPRLYGIGLVLILCLLYIAWSLFGRDPDPETANNILPQLGKYRPGIVGILVDERFDQRDMAATMLDLCNRRIIRITETDAVGYNKVVYRDFRVTLQHDPDDTTIDLLPFEKTLLQGLFKDERTAREGCLLKRDTIDFPPSFAKMRRQAWEHVMTLDWFENYPPLRRKITAGIGISLAVTGIFTAGYTNPELLGTIAFSSLLSIIPGMVYLNRFRVMGNRVLAHYWFLLPPTVLGAGLGIYAVLRHYAGNTFAEDCSVLAFIFGTAICFISPFMSKRTRAGATIKKRLMQVADHLMELRNEEGDYADAKHLIPLACALGISDRVLKQLTADLELNGMDVWFPLRISSPGTGSETSLQSVFTDLNTSLSAITGSGRGGSGGGGSGGGYGGGGGGGW